MQHVSAGHVVLTSVALSAVVHCSSPLGSMIGKRQTSTHTAVPSCGCTWVEQHQPVCSDDVEPHPASLGGQQQHKAGVLHGQRAHACRTLYSAKRDRQETGCTTALRRMMCGKQPARMHAVACTRPPFGGRRSHTPCHAADSSVHLRAVEGVHQRLPLLHAAAAIQPEGRPAVRGAHAAKHIQRLCSAKAKAPGAKH